MKRIFLGVMVLGAGCFSPAREDAGVESELDAGVDAGARPQPWLETSTHFEVSYTSWSAWTHESWYSCRALTRAELTPDQAAYMSALELVPFREVCAADGELRDTLKIFDVDGGVATYETGTCPTTPSSPAPEWMLPDDVFRTFATAGTSCGEEHVGGSSPAGGGSGSPLGGGAPSGGGGPSGGGDPTGGGTP